MRVVAGVQVFRVVGVADADCNGGSFSFWLRLRNGLLKNPLFFFCTVLSSPAEDAAEMLDPLNCFVGDVCPLFGSKLEYDVGFE
jgi:hypothetical protein